MTGSSSIYRNIIPEAGSGAVEVWAYDKPMIYTMTGSSSIHHNTGGAGGAGVVSFQDRGLVPTLSGVQALTSVPDHGAPTATKGGRLLIDDRAAWWIAAGVHPMSVTSSSSAAGRPVILPAWCADVVMLPHAGMVGRQATHSTGERPWSSAPRAPRAPTAAR